ncbi:ankyrin repeat domain-containing protein 6 [Anthonomus grandis grandis]|uniref:ankyrin repeat domain-containing protein 6 n=1 Tax=Anthonomus grandis grandis TaxID=2921223 RepID=UPI0021664DE1|nr:ankyrin repeat domain-containing protein 6 [Anthonomus grandis grandis]XP_050296941.1 ankyrin repeat domain-containing protein 6 [Anthonomus grandis grandis]XP_050296951.1 ankyrin repeat domain-containing protein 6 [Anthonomus grandis grandis]XP_050296961.1 ankyrin repeat domain-containing protein 6 [Anthonomus grandis grandis]
MSSPIGEPGAAVRAAATIGDCATLGRLLPVRGPARFTRDTQGRTAIHLAAANGRAQALRMLLAIAAAQEVDARDGAGCTALHRAAADGHEEVIRALLAKGARVDTVDTMHCNTALHECAWKGHSRTVRLLCAAGAPLGAANAGGFAPLHLACQNGHNQSCRELLLAGADPDLRNGYGDTALHTAARYGHAGVTRILISAKCKVSERNKNGDTALHISAAMGRRKLTRILLEAGCDKGIRNKQGETARDIALRKELGEILDILDETGGREGRRSKKEKGSKRRSKSKVRFEGKPGKDVVDISIVESTTPTKPPPTSGSGNNNKWSPYGCHYYPDPEAFPSPNLDSLPPEPLKKGEQYYLDLAGNICKGPVGVGYTCYCAPLFRHLEAKIERDKRELQRAQVRLGQKVAGLEQRICRGAHARRSERTPNLHKEQEPQLSRSRSLEMLDKAEKSHLQATRSMDELDDTEEVNPQGPRPSVKELVARIQQQHQHSAHNDGNNSESSDDEDGPLRMPSRKGPMGDSNLVPVPLGQPPGAIRLGHYENVPNEVTNPRSRSGVYSPATVEQTMVDSASRYIEPIVNIQEPTDVRYPNSYKAYPSQLHAQPSTSKYDPINPYQPEMRYNDPAYHAHYYEDELPNPNKFYEHSMSARLAKLRVLESSKGYPESKNPIEGSSRMLDPNFGDTRVLENPHDTIDRDTNNDSGYSTKVYGSSKGNSPSLSGQGELLGASSLV